MSVDIDGYLIDAFISVDPSYQNQVTPHPVESGADITDHIIGRPLTLSVTGVVSDTPMGDAADARSDDSAPSADAYDFLVDLWRSKRIVTVYTESFPAFTSMALRSLTPSSTATSGESLPFTATFEQVAFVDVAIENKTTIVNLPRQKKRKRKGHAPSEDKPDAKKPPIATDTGGREVGGVKAGVKFLQGLL